MFSGHFVLHCIYETELKGFIILVLLLCLCYALSIYCNHIPVLLLFSILMTVSWVAVNSFSVLIVKSPSVIFLCNCRWIMFIDSIAIAIKSEMHTDRVTGVALIYRCLPSHWILIIFNELHCCLAPFLLHLPSVRHEQLMWTKRKLKLLIVYSTN